MQIEVVDDCSTKDNPEAVVRELSPAGRVAFFRQPRNRGANTNFNTCLERSRGELVHLLHGDDLVLPGFFDKVGNCFAANWNVSIVATRSLIIDSRGQIDAISARYPDLLKPTRDPCCLLQANGIATPGVVVKRSAYERRGGFRTDLVHTADWEMWLRLITLEGGMQLHEPLAQYRMHSSNDTSRLAQSAENLRDYLRLGEYASHLSPQFDITRWRLGVAHLARDQAFRFVHNSPPNPEAAAANRALWRELAPWNK